MKLWACMHDWGWLLKNEWSCSMLGTVHLINGQQDKSRSCSDTIRQQGKLSANQRKQERITTLLGKHMSHNNHRSIVKPICVKFRPTNGIKVDTKGFDQTRVCLCSTQSRIQKELLPQHVLCFADHPCLQNACMQLFTNATRFVLILEWCELESFQVS